MKFTYVYIPFVRFELDINGYWSNDTVHIRYKIYRKDDMIADTFIVIEKRDQIAYVRDQLTILLEDFEIEDKAYDQYMRAETLKELTQMNQDLGFYEI